MPDSTTAPDAATVRAHEEFRTLLDKLRDARAEYAEWQAIATRVRQVVERKITPLSRQFCIYMRQLILVFDKSYAHPSLDDGERQEISDTICSFADAHLRTHNDARIKKIFKRHSGEDFDQHRALAKAELEKILESGQDREELVELRKRWAAEGVAAQTMHAQVIARIDNLPSAQQGRLRDHADTALINGEVLPLQVAEIELELLSGMVIDDMDEGAARWRSKILRDYLEDLDDDTIAIHLALIVKYGFPAQELLTEQIAHQCLLQQRIALEQQLKNIAEDVVDLLDIANLKAWIAQRRSFYGSLSMPSMH